MQQTYRAELAVIAAAGGLLLSAFVALSFAQAPAQATAQGKGGAGKGKARPSRPTPHWPDGRVNLGPLPGEKGVWSGGAGMTLATNVGRGVDNALVNLPTNMKIPDVPFLPWARALYDYRQKQLTADDPHVRCKASGGPRLYQTPYGFEFIEIPEMQQIFAIGVGGPHTWRVFYMDGRQHPKDLDPGYYGHSIGHWEGDTLVVDTVGFNQRFWITREGLPHTEQLHMIEKFTRTEYDRLLYEVTIDDPGAYSRPWSGGWSIGWNANGEPYEYICQDNNRDMKHMVGSGE